MSFINSAMELTAQILSPGSPSTQKRTYTVPPITAEYPATALYIAWKRLIRATRNSPSTLFQARRMVQTRTRPSSLIHWETCMAQRLLVVLLEATAAALVAEQCLRSILKMVVPSLITTL